MFATVTQQQPSAMESSEPLSLYEDLRTSPSAEQTEQNKKPEEP